MRQCLQLILRRVIRDIFMMREPDFGMQAQENMIRLQKDLHQWIQKTETYICRIHYYKYSYASNNPVMNVDLNGRFTTSTF